MQSVALIRHQTIENIKRPGSESVAGAAISLWEQLSVQIISIVGEAGFDSLYARSISLTQSAFPWLATSRLPQTEHRFKDLEMQFEGQSPSQINTANTMLLITFTDILASLIGEQLTSSILRSAWGDHASNWPGKESENE